MQAGDTRGCLIEKVSKKHAGTEALGRPMPPHSSRDVRAAGCTVVHRLKVEPVRIIRNRPVNSGGVAIH